MEYDYQIIINLFKSMRLFLERSAVQRQLLAIALVTWLAWSLSKAVWYLMGQRLMNWSKTRFSGIKKFCMHTLLLGIEYMTFPLLGIIIGQRAIRWFFVPYNWFSGLLSDFITFLLALLLYQLVMTVLHASFGKEAIRRYHYRLFAPLFTFCIFLLFLSQLTDLSSLAQVVLLILFNNPITLGALFISTIGLYFWINATGSIQEILQSVLTTRTEADPGAVQASLTIFRYIMMALGFLMALYFLGLDPTTLTAITAGLSAGIGFASKDILNNFFGGLLLLFDRSLRPGDVVSLDGEIGVVKKLSVRSTTLRTLDNIEFIVPNQTFLTSTVTSYSNDERQVRLLLPVGTSYDSNAKKVQQVLLQIADEHQLVLKDPAPLVFFTGLGDSSIDFELAIWTKNPLLVKEITSEIYFMIFEKFGEQHIEIPYPQQDLHIRSGIPWQMQMPTNGNPILSG